MEGRMGQCFEDVITKPRKFEIKQHFIVCMLINGQKLQNFFLEAPGQPPRAAAAGDVPDLLLLTTSQTCCSGSKIRQLWIGHRSRMAYRLEFGEVAADTETGVVENLSPEPLGAKDWSPDIPGDIYNDQSMDDLHVVWRIFQKIGSGPQNGAQYGAPYMEEEWEGENDAIENTPTSGTSTEMAAITDAASAESNAEDDNVFSKINELVKVWARGGRRRNECCWVVPSHGCLEFWHQSTTLYG